ncbi:hypothetical protein C8J57DRAFT_1521927 [Mycena rebaudengoi]|nr:hypothetical protein C8J57DRAFT_1521927 [Mycena rebaudengoi]
MASGILLRAVALTLGSSSGSGSGSGHRSTDPEKGPDLGDVKEEEGQLPEPARRSAANSASTSFIADYHDLDDEHDEDDIIHDMELEDDPAEAQSRQAMSPMSSFSLLKQSPPTRRTWYDKLKEFLNPKTTPQDLDSYVPNYRYTPILSGIIIPFSILLEIPGLTEHWYIRTVDNKIVETQANPMILNVGLGFSMGCAVVANICLVARFLEKKIKTMTLGCILFLTIHDVINIVAVTIFGVEHRFNDGFTYGQSFWITVVSTAVSTFTNLTLITDLYWTPDFANSGSGLTRRQRSLVILVILLLCYIAFGSLIHSITLHLNFIDAMYFSLVSIETIGFGDITPETTGARVFTSIYAAFGIVTVALAVGLTRETVLEGLEVGYRKRVQDVRLRRKVGRWKRRVANRWREAVEWRLRESNQPVWVPNDKDKSGRGALGAVLDFVDSLIPWPTGQSRSFSYGRGFLMGHGLGIGNHPHGMHLNLEALSWKQLEAAAMEAGVPLSTLLPEGFKKRCMESGEGSLSGSNTDSRGGRFESMPEPDADVPLTHARLGRMIAMIGSFALAVDKSGHLSGDIPIVRPAEKSYDAFRSGMEKEETKAFYARLSVVWMVFILFWTVGSTVFMVTEKWTFGVSIYFCFMAFTTIGYGDYSPRTPVGRAVFVVWALLGVATMTILISVIAEAFSSKYHTVLHSGVFDRAVKRYREQARAIAEKARRGKYKLFSPTSPTFPAIPTVGSEHNQSAEDVLAESHSRAQATLEALPHKILADAKSFHEHLSYFVGPGNAIRQGTADELPPGLQQLMNEITGAEKLGERAKREILEDEDARHTLFTLSIEKALRKMISSCGVCPACVGGEGEAHSAAFATRSSTK